MGFAEWLDKNPNLTPRFQAPQVGPDPTTSRPTEPEIEQRTTKALYELGLIAEERQVLALLLAQKDVPSMRIKRQELLADSDLWTEELLEVNPTITAPPDVLEWLSERGFK